MNKVTMVIPTYWGYEGSNTGNNEEIIFDHPTPLNTEGTLGRMIESFDILKDKDFKVVIIVVPNTSGIESDVLSKVREIVEPFNNKYDISLLHHDTLNVIKNNLKEKNVSQSALDLLNLNNYASVRNMCSLSGILQGSDITIFIDDDEVFTDPKFISKACHFIGEHQDDEIITAVAGYYLQPDNYYLDVSKVPGWRQKKWNNADSMNRAFDKYIGRDPRLKVTPFVFGGNMVLHKDVIMNIAFDPNITRGEDIDYLINMRISGIKFWLDKELYIKHLPPKHRKPAWKALREDIKRFLYEKEKFNQHNINIEDFLPYPGEFIGEDLEDRILLTNQLLKEDYIKNGNQTEISECEKNVELVNNNPFKEIDIVMWLKKLNIAWQELTSNTFNLNLTI